VAAVIRYLSKAGLQVAPLVGNLLGVHGTVAQAAQAFHVTFHTYHHAATARTFYSADAAPRVPSDVAGNLLYVAGLEDFERWHPEQASRRASGARHVAIGTPCSNPLGGYTPAQIASGYSLSTAGGASAGQGQSLALFELSTFQQSDISGYLTCFGLPRTVAVTVKPVDGGTTDSSGADEVTLDIELQLALAPGAANDYVYEAPNTNVGSTLEYNQIAVDDLAANISTSWGECEPQTSPQFDRLEFFIFRRMAAQGQSIYAAAGDDGAFDCGNGSASVTVDDPASQPFMVGVGGTTLHLAAGGGYGSETTWNDGQGSAGGGGASAIWPLPSYQQGVGFSTTHRNVPDVSLDDNPNTGYAIFLNGRIGFNVIGGTSAAAPLWAAFTALVNQQRAAAGKTPLGFANPVLYALAGNSTSYAAGFHDITQGTNLVFPAHTGYDNASGWGSFQGDSLLSALVGQ
jgi:kumamolisin